MLLDPVRPFDRVDLPRALRIEDDATRLRAAGVGSLDHLSTPSAVYRYVQIAHLVRGALEAEGCEGPVLDWGAGFGQLTWLLRDLGLDATGYVLEPPPREAGRGTFVDEVPLRTGSDPVRLPFADGEFRAVVSCGVLEHVPDEAASLAELHRVLTDGGLLFVLFYPRAASLLEALGWMLGTRHHPRRHTRRSLGRRLDRAGFEVLAAWERQVLPRNLSFLPAPLRRAVGRHHRWVTLLDQLLVKSPFRWIATNLECVARSRRG